MDKCMSCKMQESYRTGMEDIQLPVISMNIRRTKYLLWGQKVRDRCTILFSVAKS